MDSEAILKNTPKFIRQFRRVTNEEFACSVIRGNLNVLLKGT